MPDRRLLRRSFGGNTTGGRLFGESGTPSIAVIGGGVGGIAAGVKLKKAGIHTFTIFEKNASLGGTWYENTYPGLEVDGRPRAYGYWFKDYDWSRNYFRQGEILRYLNEVVDEWGLRPHFRFGTTVTAAVWNDEKQVYVLRAADEGLDEFNVVISAVGLFNIPRYPDWPGLADFKGVKFHTSNWRHDVDLTGKRVAIVGTGASGCDIAPMIAPAVDSLYIFQREPGWVLPKGSHDYSAAELAFYRRPLVKLLSRIRMFLAFEFTIEQKFTVGSKANTRLKNQALRYIESVFADRPDLAAAVTPNYVFLGKRLILSDRFYPTLLRENVELIARAVTRMTRSGVVDADGVEREIDVLIMATGFQPANFLASYEVVGRDGRTIHEAWDGEPRAFLGVTVTGFPNFYMIYGPNTNGGGPITFNAEIQASYAVRAIKRMMRSGITSIDVRSDFMNAYNKWLQRRLKGTVFTAANNYTKSASGTVVTNHPFRASLYWLLARTLGRVSSTVTRTNVVSKELIAGTERKVRTKVSRHS